MDAIKLLKEDHRKVEALFAQFASLGERAKKSKERVVAQIIEELKIHTQIEEKVFYPAFQEKANDEQDVYEAYEEHDVAKYVISQLEQAQVEDPSYEAKVTVLQELIDHHVKEEENEMFPEARKALGTARLKELGEAMAEMKQQLQSQSVARLRVTMSPEPKRVQQPENI